MTARKHDPIIDLIEESFRASPKETVGSLGEKLRDFVTTSRESGAEEVRFDPEIDAKIRHLTECEKGNDLAWMKYESWNVFPDRFRAVFEEIVDPLFMGAIYFSHSCFLGKMAELVRFMDFEHVINVLQPSHIFEYVAFDSNPKGTYAKVSDRRFRFQANKLMQETRFVVFRTKTGPKVVEVRRGKAHQQKASS